MGYAPNSPIIDQYTHLTDLDTVNAFLESEGIQPIKTQKPQRLSEATYSHPLTGGTNEIEVLRKQLAETQETLDELKQLVEEINKAKKEQAEKHMPTEVFSAYWILKNENIEKPEEKAHQMIPIFEKYPYWKTSEEHERHFKRELLKIFTTAQINAKQSIDLVNKILTILRGNNT